MEITYYQELLLLLVGAVAGFLNVMAGGGSLLTVPVMVFMGVPGAVANGTNRIGIVAQNIVAVATFFRRGFSDFKFSIILTLCTIPGAMLGAWYGTKLEGIWFNRVLAAIMLLVMFLMWTEKKHAKFKKKNGNAGLPHKTNKPLGYGLMALIGVYGGFIQVGVGFLLMPVLHRVFGLDLVRVNMHKVFVALMFNIVALIIFASQLQVYWMMGVSLAIGNAIGGWLGAHYSVTKGERLIRIILNSVLVVFIIKLLFF